MKRTYLKFCSFALAMVMVLAAFAGTFTINVAAEDAAKWNGTTDISWLGLTGEQKIDTISSADLSALTRGKSYILDTPEKVAGLAYIVNLRATKERTIAASSHGYGTKYTKYTYASNKFTKVDYTDDFLNYIDASSNLIGLFGDSTFYITADMDLNGSEHAWTPIGNSNNHTFFGTIVGDLGRESVETAGTGNAPTISNMKIDNTAGNQGFIGTQNGGGVQNLKFTNSYVKSTDNTIGTVVGYSKVSATYKLYATNDVAAATVTYTPTQPANATYSNLTVTNGTVITNGQQLGGIVAYNVMPSNYSNCSFQGVITSNYAGKNGTPEVTVNGTKVTKVTRAYGGSSDASVGGITGRADGGACTFNNCTVNATITLNGKRQMKSIAGIAGWVRSGSTFTDCTVTGSITATAEYINNTGGIAGYYQGAADNGDAADLKNCFVQMDITLTTVVDPALVKADLVPKYQAAVKGATEGEADAALKAFLGDYATWVKSNYSKDGTGIGGIVGDAHGTNAHRYENCYYGGTITTDYHRRVGGMVGYTNGASITFVDCQMDGIVNGANTQTGAFIGRFQGVALKVDADATTVTKFSHTETDGVYNDTLYYEKGKASYTYAITANKVTGNYDENKADAFFDKVPVATFTRCLLTGIAGQNIGSPGTYGWIGSLAAAEPYASFAKLNYENCYSNSKIPFIGATDIATSYIGYVSVNGGNWRYPTSTTSNTDLAPNSIYESGAFAILNGDSKWVEKANQTPVLKIASDANVVRTYGGADLSWFDPTAGTTTFTIDTEAKMLGAAQLSQLKKFTGVTLNATAAAVENMTEELFNMGKAAMVNVEGVNWKTLDWKWQTKKNGENVDVRFVAAVDLEEAELAGAQAGFEITYNGVTKTIAADTVYQTVTAAGYEVTEQQRAEYFGATATYLIAEVITGAPVGAEVTVRAYVVIEGVTIYGAAVTSNIPAAE